MYGDFSNTTFDPLRRYSRVLQQQGRMQSDADWNESGDLLLHALRALARDVVGRHGGPDASFQVGAVGDEDGALDFQAAAGHYYVDGLLCEADEPLRYSDQDDHPNAPPLADGHSYLAFLDVWERWTSSLQDPLLREVALAGPDTAGRARIIRQLRVHEIDDGPTSVTEGWFYDVVVPTLQPDARGRLRARARFERDAEDPRIVPPEAQYRGPENQLYRVEIFATANPEGERPATYVWSRDNGSVVFALLDLEADAGSNRSTLTLDGLHPDAQRGLAVGHWVEVRDDTDDLDGVALGRRRRLHRVISVDELESQVVVQGVPDLAVRFDEAAHPLVRRWDQDGDPDLDGALPIEEGDGDDHWHEVEDGVRVQFAAGQVHRPGDYWLIPARTLIGDVLWPQESGGPRALLPRGVTHHYAPLAAFRLQDGELRDLIELRRGFTPLAGP